MKNAKITIKKHEGAWTTGKIGGYDFEVKHFEKGSEWGIEEGRISKLWIRKTGEQQPIAAYDRGWDKLPTTDNELDITQAIIDEFN